VDLDLKNLLANKAFSKQEKVLILLAADPEEIKPVATIRDTALKNGLRGAKDWNISQILGRLDGAIRLPGGWDITAEGRSKLTALGVGNKSPTQTLQPTLRSYAAAITDAKIKMFVTETIGALEFKLYRAAVVLSWVGAVSVLYEVVLTSYLALFNAEALHRFPKWKSATTIDDLSRMKEYDFLQVINSISIIGKNTKEELEQCLKLRNTCGHPNTHVVGEHRVTSHVETLILNVFSKYVI
jgi:hypothetical protein